MSLKKPAKPAETRAWVPSHITGFFAAHRREDPLRSGSIGCGPADDGWGATAPAGAVHAITATTPHTNIVFLMISSPIWVTG